MEIGIVKGNEIKKNKDGKNNVRILQCSLSDPEDIQSIEWINTSGDDSPPENESAVFVFSLTNSYKIAIGIDDKIAPTMLAGERKLYSVDGTTIKAFINLLKTGVMELNGDADFAVRFSALQTAFDQFKTDYATHIHPGVLTGGASTGVTTPTTADITGAKIDEILVP